VENFLCSIKAFRRIATRYEKTDKCFAALINLVATVLGTR
jgi:transposase